jgi:hypothetical protein
MLKVTLKQRKRKETRMVDVSRTMVNPAAVFQDPEEVVDHLRLTREQQIDILRRWAGEDLLG